MINRFEDFVGLISNIHKNIQKIKKNEMKKFGLGGNHVMCLFYLSQFPDGVTATKLSRLIAIDKAATSRSLSELWEKGYIYYPSDEGQKKYRALVALTERGNEVTKEIDEIIYGVVDQTGSSLTLEERETMYRSLHVISENLEKLAKSKK